MTKALWAQHRHGFTLVEMLIVIIIIVMLAGLLLPAVLTAVQQAKVVAARTEIHNISVALDQYQTDFGTYPPSRVFCEAGVDAKGRFIWHTSFMAGTTTDTMDGAECLVYFLNGPGFRGWSVGTKTFGPYLPDVQGGSLSNVDTDRFQEIQDAFRSGCVYLYFRADRSRPAGSEYNDQDNGDIRDAGGVNPDGSKVLPMPGRPGRDAANNFYQATTYQLICAGRDDRYARPASAQEPVPSTDDITNFGK